ncbi:type II secretion system protein GspI [Oleispira antarctica]|uniref:Type II secretion system protein I n=1 Tax=Oleispira antarctica TaxID=188908 RepID=A0A1Y5I024_OLEAN|nr:type II secretion system protein GspI [Oleispira antarctica]
MNRALSSKQSALGFTLIEVMISLSIFAVMAAAISRTASQNADTTLYLEEKTLASFVAENRLNKLKLSGYPAATQTKDSVEMAGREWHITTKVENTQLPNFRRIDVQVAKMVDKENPLINLTGFMGKY